MKISIKAPPKKAVTESVVDAAPVAGSPAEVVPPLTERGALEAYIAETDGRWEPGMSDVLSLLTVTQDPQLSSGVGFDAFYNMAHNALKSVAAESAVYDTTPSDGWVEAVNSYVDSIESCYLDFLGEVGDNQEITAFTPIADLVSVCQPIMSLKLRGCLIKLGELAGLGAVDGASPPTDKLPAVIYPNGVSESVTSLADLFAALEADTESETANAHYKTLKQDILSGSLGRPLSDTRELIQTLHQFASDEVADLVDEWEALITDAIESLEELADVIENTLSGVAADEEGESLQNRIRGVTYWEPLSTLPTAADCDDYFIDSEKDEYQFVLMTVANLTPTQSE